MPDDRRPALRVYLIRHGQTAWSMSGRNTGLTDIALTASGERESASLAARLRGTSFSQLLASPLQRARRTCMLAGLDAAVEVDGDLVEWDYGDHEGRVSAEVHAEHPDWNLFRDGCPKGESVQRVSDRADRVIRRLRRHGGNIAVFSHGQFSRVLAMRWLGMDMIHARHFALDTASISILAYAAAQPEVPVLALWNSPPPIAADNVGEDAVRSADAARRSAIQRWENEGGEVLHPVALRARDGS